MKRLYMPILLAVTLIAVSVRAEDQTDILGQILSEVGFTRGDLGYDPKGFWARFPLDTPHRLTSFNDLFREPLYLYDYSRLMANAVDIYLDPAYADTADDGLYKLVYNLGVDRKLGGFRTYGANLYDMPDTVDPWKEVAAAMKRTAAQDRFVDTRDFDFDGMVHNFKISLKRLPDSAQIVISELLVNLSDAIYWRNLAFRNCDTADMRQAYEIRDLAMTQNDGQKYYACLDNIAATIDWSSLHYAALKVAAASERAMFRLKKLNVKLPPKVGENMEVLTPYGYVSIVPDTARTFIFSDDSIPTLLSVEFGGDDSFPSEFGAAYAPNGPVSVLLDLAGNDLYGSEGLNVPPGTGVGILGIGCVIDEDGDDMYFGSTFAQGAGLFGVGILLDRKGNDVFKAQLSAQGCGYFGIGLCLDGRGNDSFYVCVDGQGMGGIGGGIGVLANHSGNDVYIAEPDPKVFDHADYHSQGNINGNNAQGAGLGRRGDYTDGHSWAGGLGAIIDINGDDQYKSGNWSLGIGYWFSTGIAYDRSGNDNYESCYFTQGSGAHFCNGILVDEGGDDRHELYATAGAALGFGWDFTNAFLINKGGNDVYRAKMISMGLAQIRSSAFLIDVGGDDAYYLGQSTPGLGEATFTDGMMRPTKLLSYFSYAKGYGGFIDIGGVDRYVSFTDSTETDHPDAKNNSQWLQPSRADSLFGWNNYGVGIDVEKGRVPELERWDD